MNKNYKVLCCKDKSDIHHINKEHIWSVPFRLAITGKSMISGKTNLLVNLLARFYDKDFDGENIYIVSPSLNTEKLKMLAKYKKIPDSNLFSGFDEDILNELYELIKDKHQSAVDLKEKPKHSCIVFDDCSWSGDLRNARYGIISKLASNSRHQLCSCVLISQGYMDILPAFRQNMSGLVAFQSNLKEVENIADEHNTVTSRRNFIKKFQEATKKKHDFFSIDYSKDTPKRFKHNLNEIIKMDS